MPTYRNHFSNSKESVWKKIDKKGEDECWEWMGCLSRKNGYGLIGINNKLYTTHRLVYELIYSSIPNGMCVLHHCDNPKCCNPKHLFLGTARDNLNDMKNKGRDKRVGIDNGYSKLLEKDVLEIRKKYAGGKYSQRDLSKEYKTSQSNIWYIVNMEHWRHI